MKLIITSFLITVSLYASAQEIENFSLLDARSSELYGINGKGNTAVVLIFHSNKCAYSKYYIDRIRAMVTDFASEKVDFVLVNSNNSDLVAEEAPDKMKQYLATNNLDIPYLVDKEKTLKNALQATRTPEVFVLVPQGNQLKMTYRGAIDDSPQSEGDVSHAYLREAIFNLLENKRPSVNKTRPVGCLIK